MSNDLSVNMRRAQLDREREAARRRNRAIQDAIAAQRIEIPRPHVIFGPVGEPMNAADANYLRSAVVNIRYADAHGRGLWGSNVTDVVCRILQDTADAIEAGPEPTDAEADHA